MAQYKIVPLTPLDFKKLQTFCDVQIGPGYFKEVDIVHLFELGYKDDLQASFVAKDQHDLMVAARLTYAPGWTKKKGRGITPDLWKVPENTVGYFKSLFVDDKHQKKGLGGKLSRKSIEILKKQKAQAIVCHSWMQSPGNSSQKYLLSLGFEPVKDHHLFWHEVDYICTGCKKSKCTCSAQEMILYL